MSSTWCSACPCSPRKDVGALARRFREAGKETTLVDRKMAFGVCARYSAGSEKSNSFRIIQRHEVALTTMGKISRLGNATECLFNDHRMRTTSGLLAGPQK